MLIGAKWSNVCLIWYKFALINVWRHLIWHNFLLLKWQLKRHGVGIYLFWYSKAHRIRYYYISVFCLWKLACLGRLLQIISQWGSCFFPIRNWYLTMLLQVEFLGHFDLSHGVGLWMLLDCFDTIALNDSILIIVEAWYLDTIWVWYDH